ncbi:MAG: TFIIH complex serine/threonine-protein kinase subunit kin28 [Icmadophila ericetorum]|nr:TFIIH complex serine/threonine-protein kinase subunit kin28 [Icmadophila ericetorum]
MAVTSPVLVQTESSDLKLTASSAKSLTMRPNTKGDLLAQSSTAPAEAGPEITEQMNEEIKQRYVKDKKVGEGTYAQVYLGHLKSDPKSLVAIKKIKVDVQYKDGLSMAAIREVKYLQELSHPNIIALQAVFSSRNQNLNLVLEFLPLGDLEMLIKDVDGVRYGSADIKAWMGMLGRAVWFCHENFVLHRDIKPNNLLIAADGEVKLADFGLARSFSDPYRAMTHNVITRWYRPPELLYGARFYSGAVDMWSVGLVFAELIIRTPFVAGMSDTNQLELICQAIGTPTEENWPGVSKLPDYVKINGQPVRGRDFYMGTFGTVGPVGVDLLMSTLTLDPRKRATAKQLLQHKWWSSDPRPTKKEYLPRKGGGTEKMGEDLKRRGGEVDDVRGSKVARRIDFAAMK